MEIDRPEDAQAEEQTASGEQPEQPEPGEAADVEALRAELEQTRESHARAVADYRNLSRRTEEQRLTWRRLALVDVIADLLTVLDELDRALLDAEQAGLRDGKWLQGMRLVRRNLLLSLERSGLKEIVAEGEAFDPALHEAIGEAHGPAGRVVEVTRAGYTLDEHVIRPTQVVVGAGEEAPGQDEQPTAQETAAGDGGIEPVGEGATAASADDNSTESREEEDDG